MERSSWGFGGGGEVEEVTIPKTFKRLEEFWGDKGSVGVEGRGVGSWGKRGAIKNVYGKVNYQKFSQNNNSKKVLK